MDLETAEQLYLMSDVFELRLQFVRGNGRQSGIAGGKGWISWSRGEPRSPVASATYGTFGQAQVASNLQQDLVDSHGDFLYRPFFTVVNVK